MEETLIGLPQEFRAYTQVIDEVFILLVLHQCPQIGARYRVLDQGLRRERERHTSPGWLDRCRIFRSVGKHLRVPVEIRINSAHKERKIAHLFDDPTAEALTYGDYWTVLLLQ